MAKELCVQLCVYQRNCELYRNNEKLDSDFLKGCTRENLNPIKSFLGNDVGIFLTMTVVPCQLENTTVTLFFFFFLVNFPKKIWKQTAADQTMLVLSVQIKLGKVIRLTLTSSLPFKRAYSNQIFVRASIEKILKKDCSFTCGMVIYTGNKLVLCTLNRLFNKRNKRCVLPLFKGGRERPYLSLGWSIALQSHVSNILVSTNKYLNSLTSWNVNTYGEK